MVKPSISKVFLYFRVVSAGVSKIPVLVFLGHNKSSNEKRVDYHTALSKRRIMKLSALVPNELIEGGLVVDQPQHNRNERYRAVAEGTVASPL